MGAAETRLESTGSDRKVRGGRPASNVSVSDSVDRHTFNETIGATPAKKSGVDKSRPGRVQHGEENVGSSVLAEIATGALKGSSRSWEVSRPGVAADLGIA